MVSPNVQIIAMPDPFSGSASGCARTGTRGVEQRREHLGAEQLAVALVVGMGDEGDARRDQLGPSGLDHDVARTVDPRELHRVVGAGHLAVFELGLRHRGAEVDVPEGRRLGLVRLTPGEVPQERAL